ncbi:MAG TPA: hypothetical protein VFV93_14425 [Thermomicrobiales bacterium]|nr:hypothetical protein [Thermomicrobiales bacterium]
MDEFGPIQLIVIGFDSLDRFKGEIADELDAVRSRGVIRLIDALAVARNAAGDVVAIEDSDFDLDEVANLGTAIRGLVGLNGHTNGVTSADASSRGIGLTSEDVRHAAEALEPGTGALFLLIEHTWATGLKYAVRNAGGVPLVQGFLTPEAIMMVGAELRAIVDAEVTIELAEAVKGAAILDALITMEAAAEAAEDAMRVADEVIDITDAIRAQAAAEAVRALIVAELIEDAAAEEAAAVLVAAGLIEAAALAEAAEVALAVETELQAAATPDAAAGA